MRLRPPSAGRTPTASPACAWRARLAGPYLSVYLGLGLYLGGAALATGAALGAALGAGRCLGRSLGCRLGRGRCLGCSLGRRLGLCGKSHPLGTEGGVRFIRRLRGQVGDHFFALRRGRLGGLGLFLLPGGLPLGLGAGCACFIGFLIENIFFKRPSGD